MGLECKLHKVASAGERLSLYFLGESRPFAIDMSAEPCCPSVEGPIEGGDSSRKVTNCLNGDELQRRFPLSDRLRQAATAPCISAISKRLRMQSIDGRTLVAEPCHIRGSGLLCPKIVHVTSHCHIETPDTCSIGRDKKSSRSPLDSWSWHSSKMAKGRRKELWWIYCLIL
jgi:hypothetical protein